MTRRPDDASKLLGVNAAEAAGFVAPDLCKYKCRESRHIYRHVGTAEGVPGPARPWRPGGRWRILAGTWNNQRGVTGTQASITTTAKLAGTRAAVSVWTFKIKELRHSEEVSREIIMQINQSHKYSHNLDGFLC